MAATLKVQTQHHRQGQHAACGHTRCEPIALGAKAEDHWNEVRREHCRGQMRADRLDRSHSLLPHGTLVNAAELAQRRKQAMCVLSTRDELDELLQRAGNRMQHLVVQIALLDLGSQMAPPKPQIVL